MMYLMCLFQALPHSAEDAPAAPRPPPVEALASDDVDVVAVEVRLSTVFLSQLSCCPSLAVDESRVVITCCK